MQTYTLPASLAVLALCAHAAEIRGTVIDPSGAAIPGAQVSAVARTGVLAQTTTGRDGAYELTYSGVAGVRIVVTAPGFETRTVPPSEAARVPLSIAPQVDSVRVAGSTLDIAAEESGASVSVIPRQEIRDRNEPMALDLLRYLPGVTMVQSGPRGSVGSMFLRGGDYNYNLVEIDGVPVNAFGGAFDFAHIPAELLDHIDVVRGPESAVYGPYAISGVVNLVTRTSSERPTFDVLAEGGTYHERRFGLGGADTWKGWGLAASASRIDTDGPVANSDYRNQFASLGIDRNSGRHSLALHGYFDANEAGEPGPYGSNPAGFFPGLDTVSRLKNNFSDYSAQYRVDVSSRVREELFGTWFQQNTGYASPYGDSYNKDTRGQGEARTVVSISRAYVASFGFAFAREQEKNTYITDDSFRAFPLRRDQEGVYWENRFDVRSRLFLNAGVRAEFIRTPAIPADFGVGRPAFPANDITKVNPKLAATYVLHSDRGEWAGATRVHASFGTGIRPPGGFDLAFTNNPALKPERTVSFDAGIDQRLARNRLALEATYFYSHFSDLIVSLGGSLAQLSSYQSDNLANSRAQGLEFAARLRPARHVSVDGSYTYLKTEILSLNGSSGLAPKYFRVSQELIRRPAHSGAVVSTFSWGRVTAGVSGYFRGEVLDVEPNLGAGGGLFRNGGYANVAVNLNCRVGEGVSVYGNLRNALNRRYEEAFGYPAPLLNFVAGVKWIIR